MLPHVAIMLPHVAITLPQSNINASFHRVPSKVLRFRHVQNNIFATRNCNFVTFTQIVAFMLPFTRSINATSFKCAFLLPALFSNVRFCYSEHIFTIS